jgi:hypothetical protein
MKLLYKPLGLALGALAGAISGAVVRRVWRRVAHESSTPEATDGGYGWREVVAAAALQGAVFGAVKALVDRAGATGFARVTGVWPGEKSRGVRRS